MLLRGLIFGLILSSCASSDKSKGEPPASPSPTKQQTAEATCELSGKVWEADKCITPQEQCSAYRGVFEHGNCIADLKEEAKFRVAYKYLKSQNSLAPFSSHHPHPIFERGLLSKGTRVCLLGDTGNGSLAQRKIASLLPKNCDQVRHLGDIIYYMGIQDMHDEKFKERFLDVYQDLGVPMFITIGNHDYYKNPDIWLEVSKEYPTKFIFPNNYYLDIYAPEGTKGLCFLSLDSTPIHDLKYGDDINKIRNAPRVKEQFEWVRSLKPLLNERCNYVMSFFHHPYLSVGEGRGDTDSEFFVKEFMEGLVFPTVDFMVTGHDHFLAWYPRLQKKEMDKEHYIEIPELISGSGGMLQVKHQMSGRKFSHEFRETGFVQMTLQTDSNDENPAARFTFFRFDGQVLYQFDKVLKRVPKNL